NGDGAGGFSKGASLSGMTMPAAWNRSLFNGRAQVIIQHTGKGRITFKAKWGRNASTTVFHAL
ncbi:MAG: hypothetical protein WCG75_05145, partial [Armatimonadota bacterium]